MKEIFYVIWGILLAGFILTFLARYCIYLYLEISNDRYSFLKLNFDFIFPYNKPVKGTQEKIKSAGNILLKYSRFFLMSLILCVFLFLLFQ